MILANCVSRHFDQGSKTLPMCHLQNRLFQNVVAEHIFIRSLYHKDSGADMRHFYVYMCIYIYIHMVFSNNSCRIRPIKLKIVMLHYMKIRFQHVALLLSVPGSWNFHTTQQRNVFYILTPLLLERGFGGLALEFSQSNNNIMRFHKILSQSFVCFLFWVDIRPI